MPAFEAAEREGPAGGGRGGRRVRPGPTGSMPTGEAAGGVSPQVPAGPSAAASGPICQGFLHLVAECPGFRQQAQTCALL
eukprot:16428179-Heterocapsa_arctica.AAC.1